MIDVCIRDGQADLFMEWHHFWQPESKDDLWPVGPQMGKAALDEFAKRWPEEKTNHLEDAIASMYFPGVSRAQHDGPQPARFKEDLWHLRTDRLCAETVAVFHFASVAGPTDLFSMRMGYYFALGQATAKEVQHSVVISADGFAGITHFEQPGRVRFALAFVVCRGDAVIPGSSIVGSVLLVDGDIDLTK